MYLLTEHNSSWPMQEKKASIARCGVTLASKYLLYFKDYELKGDLKLKGDLQLKIET